MGHAPERGILVLMRNGTNESQAKTAMTTIGGQMVLSDRLSQFRKIYRWFNLTLIHQGTWPLLLVLTSAPLGKAGDIPMPWYLARLAGPALAVMFALLYVRNQQQIDEVASFATAPPVSTGGRPSIALQVKVALLGLTAMLVIARLIAGPIEPAAKVILFGSADVLAFQLIHFEVVRRSYRDQTQGIGLAVVLFGLSWGLRDMMLTLLGPTEASPALALLTGVILGLVVAAVSRVLRSWPGGFWSAAAAQFLFVYLVIGFVG